jgi:hypothetical protein
VEKRGMIKWLGENRGELVGTNSGCQSWKMRWADAKSWPMKTNCFLVNFDALVSFSPKFQRNSCPIMLTTEC